MVLHMLLLFSNLRNFVHLILHVTFGRDTKKPFGCFLFLIPRCSLPWLQEGKRVKSQSGFKGKGFKFDETEAHLVSERKKLQRAAMGFQDSDDEESGMDVSDIYLHILMAVFDSKS